MAKDKENDDDGKDKDEELVIVTDDKENLKALAPGATDDDGAPEPTEVKEKKTPKDEEDDDDEPEEDKEETRLGVSEETEREAEDKEKTPHKSRRQRRKEAEQRLRRERDFLEKRNDTLERQIMQLSTRMDTTDRANLEARIKHTKGLIRQSEEVIAEATTKQKGTELVEAQRIRDTLKDELGRLEEQHEVVVQPQRRAPDPQIVANAQDWTRNNTWYDPQLRDVDSRIVRVIDEALIEEGLDPRTKKFWKELDKRVAQRLPHIKANGEDQDDTDEEDEETPRPRKKERRSHDDDGDERPTQQTKRNGAAGGPRFRTGGPGRELKANEVYLSRDRIEALKEAGVWDDPETRKKYLKKYRDYDREHAND